NRSEACRTGVVSSRWDRARVTGSGWATSVRPCLDDRIRSKTVGRIEALGPDPGEMRRSYRAKPPGSRRNPSVRPSRRDRNWPKGVGRTEALGADPGTRNGWRVVSANPRKPVPNPARLAIAQIFFGALLPPMPRYGSA